MSRLLVIALCLLAWHPAHASAEEPTATLRVLFLGNSYTRFNLLPQLVRRLSQAALQPTPLSVEVHARAGYTLRMHWRSPEVRRAIRSGRFSHVVLQDHSMRPIDHADEFADYVTRLKQEADRGGSRTILYETWPRRPGDRLYRSHGVVHDALEMRERVESAYLRVARQLGAAVAPVGRAFFEGLGRRPDIDLYRDDGTHPSWAGSFLAACVLYGTITGQDPRATPYYPWELDASTAQVLRSLAADVLAEAPAR